MNLARRYCAILMRMVITPINKYGMSHSFRDIHSVAIIAVTAFKKYNCNPNFPILDILKNMKSKNKNDNE